MNHPGRGPLRRAGTVLFTCSLGFVAVFAYLARTFDYPQVLARGAGEVLPRLAAGGSTLRAVWFIYAALPLGILRAALASATILARGGRRLRTTGVVAGAGAAVAMTAGLVRWPTLMWGLARSWMLGPPPSHASLADTFATANRVLGNVVGEFVGEMLLALWSLAVAVAHRRTGRRVVGTLGLVAATLLAVAAFRNVTAVAAPVAAINNVTLPLWLLTLGVLLFRDGARPAAVR